jgi:hypothetical protein
MEQAICIFLIMGTVAALSAVFVCRLLDGKDYEEGDTQ